MPTSHSRLFLTLALCGTLSSCAYSQPQPAAPTKKSTLRTLIVAGGPDPDYNQYALESNARYLEKLTATGASQRILFADGKKTSRTISTVEPLPDAVAQTVFAWVLEQPMPGGRTGFRAPTLKRLDGPATKDSVLQSVRQLVAQVKSGQHGLVYFTGHGSLGHSQGWGPLGDRSREALENTTYSVWNDGELSVKELAAALQKWPAKAPLVLVMVQCHSGGFANVMFEGGDPKKPVWDRDFCGFFAATADRESSGCTSEVDERDYQDFTTHFFAALSGRSRSGQPVSGTDYDHDGTVSLLEAYAWTHLIDTSIDVPVCTSDAYLRTIYPQKAVPEWLKTPYATLLANATPWQKAILEGLSRTNHLSGENRITTALSAFDRLKSAPESSMDNPPAGIDPDKLSQSLQTIETTLHKKFPGLKAPHRSARYISAKRAAIAWLKNYPNDDVRMLNRAASLWGQEANSVSSRQAILWRFIRTARTVVLQDQLEKNGTPAQKAVFARLRLAESRNPLLP